jgi:putative transposase
VKVMCDTLSVSTSGFYAWKDRPPSTRARRDMVILDKIRCIHADSRATYGSPRIHVELRDDHDVFCGRKRVARLMAGAGIRGCCRRRKHWTTRKDRGVGPAPDLLERDFTSPAPDRRWVADITYVKTWQGVVYLSFVLDLFSRRIVGWAMRNDLPTELVLDAINMAIASRKPVAGLVHHSDHGGQYTSLAFGKRLKESGILSSMGSVGDAYDNSAAESFIATLKCELLYRYSWPTRTDAELAIFDFIEVFYNRRRRHSTIAQVSPLVFEKRYWSTASAG